MSFIEILKTIGKNEIMLGISTVCGIAGFIMTIIVTIRTAKIASILRHNQLTVQYNKERSAFQNAFEGHCASIAEDNIHTQKILKDILKNVEAYSAKFGQLLPLDEKIRLFFFKRLLKKEPDSTNWNTICNHLAILSGHLSKKEEKKNG